MFSHSEFRDNFSLTKSGELENTSSTVTYKIKDYDFVGPDDFHTDRSLDQLRNNLYNKPYLQIDINFLSAEKKSDGTPVETLLTMIYPLEERHLLINKSKKSFRA